MLARGLTGTVIILLILTGTAASQTTFATLTGTVTDSSGSVIPGVTIEVTHLATKYQHSAVSNEVGVYTLPQLREGDYLVRARLSGFREVVVDVQLAARDIRRLDFMLQLGAVEETVQVVGASAGLIETETARISDTKDAELLQRLPLNTRSTLGLLNQTAGVYERTGTTGSATIRYGGSRTNQENAAIDGITFLAMDGTAIHPMAEYMESVRELRVDLGNNTAEFGAVGQMTLISKSGSNQVHGSLFDYYSTNALNARNPFAPERASGVRHSVGGSLGGPIEIPGLYSGTNKSFFFGTYETNRGGALGQLLAPSVPLPSWRAGDFSALGPGVVIRDPFNGGAPFPNNRIPPERINPVALKIQERFYPLPNTGNPNVFAAQNYRQVMRRDFDPNTMWTTRIDHRFSERAFVFGRYSWTRQHSRTFTGTLPTIGQQFFQRDTRHLVMSYSHTLRPTLLNESRFGFAFNDTPRNGPLKGREMVEQFGLVGLVDNLPDINGVPNVSFSGLGVTGITQLQWRHPGFRNRIHQFQNHTTWFRGRNAVKFGLFLTRTYFAETIASNNLFGGLTFSNRFTGHPYADFLLGIPTTAARAFPPLGQERLRWHYEFFVTNDVKLTPKLTLNLGARYEYNPGFIEPSSRMANFDIQTGKVVVPSGSLSLVSPLLPRGYVDVIEARAAGFDEKYLVRPDRNNIAPRIGLAYRPWDDRTVFRTGFGIFYDVTPVRVSAGGSPFEINEPAFTNPMNAPTVILPRVFPASTGGGPSTVGLPTAVDPNLVIPYSMQYSLTVEHERWGHGFRLSYLGTNTRDGEYSYDVNQPVADTRPFVDKPRLFPLYPAVNYLTNGAGHQYDSLTAQVRRRYSRGVSYEFTYTLARDMGDLERGQSPEDAFDRDREWGRWRDIPTHRVTSHLIYQLPFGNGRAFSSGNKPIDWLISGWEMSAVYILHSGNFLTPMWSGPDPTGTRFTTSRTPPIVTIRPDQLRDPNLPAGERSVNRWFDPSAFAAPAPGRFGTAAKGVIRGPGVNVLHAGLAREIAVQGSVRLRLEITGTNILNTPNWSDPGLTVTSVGQAGVITGAGGVSDPDQADPRSFRLGIRLDW